GHGVDAAPPDGPVERLPPRRDGAAAGHRADPESAERGQRPPRGLELTRVLQLVPFLERADAVGDHARNLARVLGPSHGGFVVQGAAPEHSPVGRDRKSTRLNSSHVAISYAVFCLKKKK